MGNANMSEDSPQDNSKPDNSDDLIAQLAQLMADDAQSSRDEVSVSDDELSEPAIALKSNDSSFLTSEQKDIPQRITQTETLDLAKAPDIDEVSANDFSENKDPIADLISSQIEKNEISLQESDVQARVEEIAEKEVELIEEKVDIFETPPVFGLGTPEAQSADLQAPTSENSIEEAQSTLEQVLETNPQVQETQQADSPIIDIENLIGEAVKAGMPEGYGSGNSEPKVSISQEGQADIDSAANAAENAILAATASTDFTNESQNEHSDNLNIGVSADIEQTSDSDADVYSRPKKPFMSSMFGPAIAGTALLAIGFGLFLFLGNSSDKNTDIPVLNADAQPQKITPTKTDEVNSQDSQSVVFDEIAGKDKTGENEQIVSRDESANENSNPVTRVIPTDASSSDSNLANIRVVRTVTVRPDGTIINGDSARAGANALPVDKPNVPQLPEGSVVEVPEIPIVNVSTEQPVTAVVAPIDPTIKAPTPFVRPANLELVNTSPAVPIVSAPVVSAPDVNSNSTAVDLIASNANQDTTPAAPAVISSNAPAYVQLSSQRAEQTARASLNSLKNKYSSIFGSNQLEIQRANLGDKGIYYRVRLPANSINSANQICANIKQAGGECFVRTN